MGRIAKLVVIVAVLYVAWKYGLPLLQHRGGGGTQTSQSATQSSCPGAASQASETWGSGLHSFVNPPYDLAAWSSFKDGVDAKISAAEGECSCSSESCDKVRAAMRDLRSLATELDTAIRAGSPPPADIVQRQEAIDKQIDEAAELTRAGK
jgi:hypothetical protein